MPQLKPGTIVPTPEEDQRIAPAALEGTGDGWQTRINDALRVWAREHALAGR